MAILPQHLLAGRGHAGRRTSSATRSAPARISSRAGTSGSPSCLDEKRELLQGCAEDRPHHLQDRPGRQCAGAAAGVRRDSTWRCSTRKTPQQFTGKDGFTCYDMKTSDYRGILFNFWNDYWTREPRHHPRRSATRIDRQAIVDAVLLGQGMPAYGPLQRNIYNNENVEHYDYNPEKAKTILEDRRLHDGRKRLLRAKRRGDRLRHQRHGRRAGPHRHRTGCRAAAARGRHPLHGGHPGTRWTGADRWPA